MDFFAVPEGAQRGHMRGHMTRTPSFKKLPAALSVAVVAFACVASAVTAGGQVVDQNKVVEDPQLDYRKYSKQIQADEKAQTSQQAAAMSSAQLSVGMDEANFHASLAAVAQSLNAGAPQDGTAPADTTEASAAAPVPAETAHGLSIGAWIGLAVAGLVAVLLAVLGLSSLGRRKSRRRRRQHSEEKSVSLVEFARKPAAEKNPEKTED